MLAVEDGTSQLCAAATMVAYSYASPTIRENFPLELLTSIKSSVSRFWSVFYINRKVTNKLFESLGKTPGPIPRDSDIAGLGHNLGTGNVKSVQF